MDSIPPELLTHEIFAHIGVENQYAVYRTCKRFRSLLKIKPLTTESEVHSGCKSGDVLGVMKSRVVIDPNWGLYCACRGGNRALVCEMIARGATDWNGGLFGACADGHLELVRDMIARGATNLHSGMQHALKGGHHEIVREMIARGVINRYSVV